MHLLQYDNTVSKDIMDNLYVDNLISGVESVDKAIKYYKETKKIFSEASMNMCKWLSNKTEVMNCIAEEDKSKETNVKVLGMLWNTISDELHLINIKETLLNESLTKRTMLRIISSVFDPTGIISPVVLLYKRLIQKV